MLESFDGSSALAFDDGPDLGGSVGTKARSHSLFPTDWPEAGPIDLEVHDLPHQSSTTEWWYAKAHLDTADGRSFSVFAAFFRVLKGRCEETGELEYAHSLTWAFVDTDRERYFAESRVDKCAPQMGIEKIDRGDGTKDHRLRRAMREVCAKGKVPFPDRVFESDPYVGQRKLELEFEGARFCKDDQGHYHLTLRHPDQPMGCKIVLRPRKAPVRHGDQGVVRGSSGEDMFYYFIPRCDVSGEVLVDGAKIPVTGGEGWYDHEFGRHPDGPEAARRQAEDIAWNWTGLQLDDGTEITAYTVFDLAGETVRRVDERILVVDPDGRRHDYPGLTLEPLEEWKSTRTFNAYPTKWKLSIPERGLELILTATFQDQEFVTVISKPAFWEGRVDVEGFRRDRRLTGRGFVERSGFSSVEDLETFFKAVGRRVRQSVRELYPLCPTHEEARDLIGSSDREQYMDGVDVQRFADTMIAPVREITDRGGKSWRSYAALACCDIVGGDSRNFVQWLAMPEFMHVGSLIVDDVQDRSDVRRGGKTCHLIYGDAHSINAGTAAYFMGQQLLESDEVSREDQLRLYSLYFEALRAGHAGQALDIEGFDDRVPAAVESGDGYELEKRILAIHRLKTAAPAAALARMGAVAGAGTEDQIEAVGTFFEALGLAFQIIDDVLNLRGFKKGLKARGEDIMHGKVTLPVAKALSRLGPKDRGELWATVSARPQDQAVIDDCIDLIEQSGALDACVQEAQDLVEEGWRRLDPMVEDSLPKIILRAFGWYVLERHY